MAAVESRPAPAVSRVGVARYLEKMKNWRKIAEASNPELTEEDLERIASALASLEAAFAPLSASLNWDADAAVIFRAAESGE